MDRLCAGLLRDFDDPFDAQIAFARSCRADAIRFVGKPHMARTGVGFGIDGDGANAEPAAGLDDAAGDFAAIGNQDFREHRSEEHTYELQSLMRISYAVFCLKKKKKE